jgi:hypothetical protein
MALDFYLQRYGWDYWQYRDTPKDVLEELDQVIRAEGDYTEGLQGRGGMPPDPGERTNAEIVAQAAGAGLPMPAVVPEG